MTDRWRASLPARGDIERILVIKWGAMGDVVIATAAMQDIALAFPYAQIDLSIMRPWDALFTDDPRIDRVRPYDARGADAGLSGLLALAKAMSCASYDAVFDLQSNDRSRLLMMALRALGGPRYRAGFHRRWPYNLAAPPPSPPVHASTYANGLLAAVGIESRTTNPVLHISPTVREGVSEQLESLGLTRNHYAVFFPGCAPAGYLKRWGSWKYLELARQVVPSRVEQVVLVGGPDEAELCAEIARGEPARVVNLCGQTELLDVVPLCEAARFIVGNDTGTAHLASAAGRPLCVICGPTDPRRVKPLGSNVSTCQADLACVNCYRKHCSHHACMAMVTPAQVLSQLPPADLA